MKILKNVLYTAATLAVLGVSLLIYDAAAIPSAGAVAPAFKGISNAGQRIALADYRGKKNVVLVFYPKDFSPGCTRELCTFRDNEAELKRYDAVIVGVSYDDSASHADFVLEESFPFALISDSDKSISKSYGTARFGGVIPFIKRVTIVIDKTGVIRDVLHDEFSMEGHYRSALDALARIQGGA